MKSIFILTIALLLPLLSLGQYSKIIDQLKNRYKDHEDVVSLSFNGNFLGMANWFTNDENEEDEAVQDLIKSIDRMNILTIPKGEKGIRENELNDLRKEVSKENFEDLMVIRDGNDRINIMVKEKDGIISHLLMVIDDDQELTILDFVGSISMDDVALLTDNVNFN